MSFDPLPLDQAQRPQQLFESLKAATAAAHAADVILPKMSGLRIAESTVERTTEAVGQELREAWQAKVVFGTVPPRAWPRDAQGKTWAYLWLDWTGIAKQGPGGVTAAGEM